MGRFLRRPLAPLFNRFRLVRDHRQLRSVPRQLCDATVLRPGDSGVVQQLLSGGTANEEWPSVVQETEGLGITTAAEGVNPGDRRALYHLVRALRPAAVLEIGTHVGASTAHLVAGMRRNATDASPALVSVDLADVNDPEHRIWERAGSRFAPVELIRRMGAADWVRFVTSPSLEFLRETRDSFDLIFLDGDHSAATVYREVPAALARLNPGGVLLLHDYFPGLTAHWADGIVISGPLAGNRATAGGRGRIHGASAG